MGSFQAIRGDYAAQLQYLQEAADTLDAHPELELTEGSIQLFGNLGNLYAQIGMFDKAKEFNDKAIGLSRRQGGVLMTDLYRMRAFYYNDPDSIMACYQAALAALETGVTNRDKEELRRIINLDKAGCILESPDDFPDSVAMAIKVLEEGVEADEDEYGRAERLFSLGQAYLRQGRRDDGLRLMEQALAIYQDFGDVQGEGFALQSLIDTYHRLGMQQKLFDIYPRYKMIADSLLNVAKTNAVIESDARYNALLKEQENQRLNDALAMSRQRVAILILAIILAVTVAFLVIVQLYKRYKSSLRKRMSQREYIKRLLNQQIELNSRIEDLDTRLCESANKEQLTEMRQILVPAALHGDNEIKFRKVFAGAYPHFLPDLRGDFPDLTPNDELVAMLIYVRQNTDEISLTLGISRASVNSARYRLRKKLALDKDTDLDRFIASRR